ncbi:MAG: hypothetical protein VB045_04895, partial [Synergistaceae bacterium]|nr:hypothetical protein [Synergistaceae bacterium]
KTRRAAAVDDARILLVSRMIVLLVVALSGSIALGAGQSLILSWAYVGMGIKGAGILIPLLAAVFRPGILPRRYSFLSGAGGLAGVLFGTLFLKGIDPLFPGLALSGVIALAGMKTGGKALGRK